MTRKTFWDLYEANLDDWIAKGNGITTALYLMRTAPGSKDIAFMAWAQDRVFECERCGSRFCVYEEKLGEHEEVLCEDCRQHGKDGRRLT